MRDVRPGLVVRDSCRVIDAAIAADTRRTATTGKQGGTVPQGRDAAPVVLRTLDRCRRLRHLLDRPEFPDRHLLLTPRSRDQAGRHRQFSRHPRPRDLPDPGTPTHIPGCRSPLLAGIRSVVPRPYLRGAEPRPCARNGSGLPRCGRPDAGSRRCGEQRHHKRVHAHPLAASGGPQACVETLRHARDEAPGLPSFAGPGDRKPLFLARTHPRRERIATVGNRLLRRGTV